MARYSYTQLVNFARQAGFSASIARTMAAIALAESSGNSSAFNGNTRTGDQSYGLWQINMLGAMGPERRRMFGISSNSQLFDPRVNARAAYAIYRMQGLRAWSVYKSGSYRKFMSGSGGSGASTTERPMSGWVRPVASGRMSQGYGVRNSGYKAGHHTGLDFSAPTGTPVYAASSGKVVRVANGGAYGRRVEIAHSGKVWTLYAHLSAQNVRVGQSVRAGQMIGRVGSTGNSKGAHLHFEVRAGTNAYRATVNPMAYLNGRTTPTGSVPTGPSSFETSTTEYLPLSDMLSLTEPEQPPPGNVPAALMVGGISYSPVASYGASGVEPWDTGGESTRDVVETFRPAVGA